jgi:hypothetical protein
MAAVPAAPPWRALRNIVDVRQSVAILQPMAEDRTPDQPDGLAQAPSSVQVTVLPGPRDRGRERIGRRSIAAGALRRAPISAHVLVIIAVALVVVTIGAIVAAPRGHGTSAPPEPSALARNPGPAGVAAAYGYPLHCLSVTISTRNPAYARADFDRGTQCGRFHLYVTAIFHRVDGAWRRALVSVGYSCPVASLPKAVQEQLVVCP